MSVDKIEKKLDSIDLKLPENWKNFEVQCQYIETDSWAFARRAFSYLNGKGKKPQSKYHLLRNAVNIVRIDKDTTDEEEVAIEKKVAIAENNQCFPVEENSQLLKYPGVFTNIATFNQMTDEEVEIATSWQNKYFHYEPIHVGTFFVFKNLVREFEGSKMILSDKLLEELAGLLQTLFQGMKQYSESCKEAYNLWYKNRFRSEKLKWNDDAYVAGLLHLYQKFGGKESIPPSLLGFVEDFINFFDDDLLELADNNPEEFLKYEEVTRKPNPMVKINPLKRASNKVVSIEDRMNGLVKTKAWQNTMKAWKKENKVFNMDRRPKVSMVKLGDIVIDCNIQRELDEKHCAKIADPKRFDPALMQVLQCIKTTDGKFISTDGQHTATVLAGIFYSLSEKTKLEVK
jgi:hypothetical protein